MRGKRKVKTRTLENHKGAAPKLIFRFEGAPAGECHRRISSDDFLTVMTLEKLFLHGGIIF
jgi:hypothetical protein